jgi:nicotinamidase-related amidase
VLTHNSVEATVRMGGNLGFEIYVVSDGCFAVDKRTLDGRLFPAADVHALSLANMSGEYATVVDTAWILART